MRRLLPLFLKGTGERSSMTLTSTLECIVNFLTLKRRRYGRYELIMVDSRPESVLSDVLAIHTIEMIPKSMILNFTHFLLDLCRI